MKTINNAEGVTIILCCYNSEQRLPETIKHIGKQIVSKDIQWEIVLIDNGSVDNTSEVANQLAQEYLKDIPFRAIYEASSGLSNARRRGIKEARFEYLLFCDDDNWLDVNYVNIGFNILSKNSKIGVLGGQSIGEYEINPPQWFLDHKMSFAIGKQSDTTKDVTDTRGWLFGAGFFNRKSLLDKLDSSDFIFFLTGRKGNVLSTGEDKELCFVIKEMGYRIQYQEDLIFKHFMPSGRFNYIKFIKMAYFSGRASYIYNLYDNRLLNRSFLGYWIFNMLYCLTKFSIALILKALLLFHKNDFKVKNDMRYQFYWGKISVLIKINYCLNCLKIKRKLIENINS